VFLSEAVKKRRRGTDPAAAEHVDLQQQFRLGVDGCVQPLFLAIDLDLFLVDCFRYALSQGMTTIPSAGDPNLVPDILDAANAYEPLDEAEQERLREAGCDHESPVPAP